MSDSKTTKPLPTPRRRFAQKLVLTGGPSGGKTTLAQAIQQEFSSKVIIVPESATILYSGGWPRRKNTVGQIHQQKAIYFVMRELESMIAAENPDRLIICDRGSLDGIAYWPGEGLISDFLDAVESTIEKEIARYDWCMHLDTAPAASYDLTNLVRNESHDEAWKLNERIREAWAPHPKRFLIENHEGGHFLEKMQRALYVVESIIAGKAYEEINVGMAAIK